MTIRYSGEVAVITISVDVLLPSQGGPNRGVPEEWQRIFYEENRLLEVVGGQLGEMHAELTAAAREHLGPDIRLDRPALRRGSVEVIIVASAVYHAIKNVNDFIETLEKFREHARRIVLKVLEPHADSLRAQSRIDVADTLLEAAAGEGSRNEGQTRALLARSESNLMPLLVLVQFVALAAVLIALIVKL